MPRDFEKYTLKARKKRSLEVARLRDKMALEIEALGEEKWNQLQAQHHARFHNAAKELRSSLRWQLLGELLDIAEECGIAREDLGCIHDYLAARLTVDIDWKVA